MTNPHEITTIISLLTDIRDLLERQEAREAASLMEVHQRWEKEDVQGAEALRRWEEQAARQQEAISLNRQWIESEMAVRRRLFEKPSKEGLP